MPGDGEGSSGTSGTDTATGTASEAVAVRPERHIVAMGGGGFSSEPENPLLDDFVLELTGKDRPRISFLGQASGDRPDYFARFVDAFGARAAPSRLNLFDRTVVDIDALLAEQDAIYVGGGNTANMLAIWRIHGVDRALRGAWERGVVLAGPSAGAICWFEGGTTDSFGRALQPLLGGLAFLDGSCCPHFDEEPRRRPAYHALVREGQLPPGWALDDGAALHFVGTEMREAVSSRPGARAFRVDVQDGEATETAVPIRYLGPDETRTAPPFPGD